MPVPTPTKIVDAFGHNAGPDFINAIPETTAVPGAASYDQGFPPLTMTAPAAGGIPPFGQDMNGVLNQITGLLAAFSAGQLQAYDGAYATAIGGYALGAAISMADGSGLWLNVTAANSTNPDTGGAGWLAICSFGAAVVGVTTGTVTLTAAQWKKPRIAFTGALTGNVTVNFPAIDSQEWLLCNLTSGAFVLTVKTAAGTGVVIPQGGVASPTGVYCDTTNIQFTVSPLAVPIDQAANPLTLAERTNAGYLLATYFNQSSPSAENPAIGAVFVESTGADGFLRKVTLANFLAQALPPVAVAATPATLVERDGTGYVFATYLNQSSGLEVFTPDAVFAESASDGFLRKISPANFIAALGLATQAYANGTSGSNGNGFWYKLPNGVIEQYGVVAGGGGGPVAHTFPIPFPTACDALSGTAVGVQGTIVLSLPAASRISFTINNGAGGSSTSWRAVGH